MDQEPRCRGSQDHRRGHQGRRVLVADWHAAGARAWWRALGSAQQPDAWPHRAGAVLRTRRAHGVAARVHQEDTENTECRPAVGSETNEGDRMTKRNKGRVGSSFDDWLKEEGIYEEVSARAIKRVIARQL